jgi:hypothetical protein
LEANRPVKVVVRVPGGILAISVVIMVTYAIDRDVSVEANG